MNLKQCREWTQAVASVSRGRGLKFLSRHLAKWGERPGERWEGGLSSRSEFSSLRLRLHGSGRTPASLADWFKINGLAAERGRPAGDPFPCFRLDWNVDLDRPERAALYFAGGPGRAVVVEPGSRSALKAERWSKKWVSPKSSIAPIVAGFSQLCEIEHVILGPDRVSLRLTEGLPWPRFARLDVLKPWESKGSQLSHLLLNFKVRELLFQPGDLTIYFHS